MPQLAPMNWLVLFFYFSGLLYLTAVKLFFVSKTYISEMSSAKELASHTMTLKI